MTAPLRPEAAVVPRKGAALKGRVLGRLLRARTLVFGGCLVGLVVLMAVLAPVLATHDPIRGDLPMKLKPPGTAGHLLGTDDFGRDVWSRLVHGGRVSLQVGLLAVAIAAAGGLVLGVLAGYAGGWVDLLTGRVLDVLLAFPPILLALAIVSALGPSPANAALAIGVTGMPRFGRVIRASVLAQREREFVLAARALGAGHGWVITRHILPNIMAPFLVVVSQTAGGAVLTEASLSFLGLGAPPPTPTWGAMVTEGKQLLDSAPWVSAFSGLSIMVTVLGLNLLADGLRDLLDPKLRT